MKPARVARAVLPVSVVCPSTGDVAIVEIACDWRVGNGVLAVARCECFPTGAFQCDRECFPAQDLMPIAGASGSPA